MSLSPPRLPWGCYWKPTPWSRPSGPWPDGPGKTPIRSLRSLTGVFGDGLPNPAGQGDRKSRSALCGGILLACGANRPTLVSPA